jgi:hypothetical protein
MVDATEARKDLPDGVLIGDIHDDGVHLPQLLLGLEELLLGAAGDRDLRAFVLGVRRPSPSHGSRQSPRRVHRAAASRSPWACDRVKSTMVMPPPAKTTSKRS